MSSAIITYDLGELLHTISAIITYDLGPSQANACVNVSDDAGRSAMITYELGDYYIRSRRIITYDLGSSQANACVNVSDDAGRTPLQHAACEGHGATVRALLRAGAKPGQVLTSNLGLTSSSYLGEYLGEMCRRQARAGTDLGLTSNTLLSISGAFPRIVSRAISRAISRATSRRISANIRTGGPPRRDFADDRGSAGTRGRRRRITREFRRAGPV